MFGDNADPVGYAGGNEELQGTDSAGNPAWKPFFEAIPQEYHEKVTPLLREWDKGVNDRFQKVHSEYEPYKPFIGQYKPEDINWGLQLAQVVQSDPRKLWDTLGEHYGYFKEISGQGQQEPDQQQPEPNPYEQEIAHLRQQQEIIARAVLAREQKEQAARAEVELDREFSDLKKKYGEFDDQYVSALMLNGLSGEQAVQQYQAKMQAFAKQFEPRFTFLGSGGGVPTSDVDVTKMSAQDRRKLAVQMLEAAKRQDQS